jgi:hypothetical protein
MKKQYSTVLLTLVCRVQIDGKLPRSTSVHIEREDTLKVPPATPEVII